MICSFLPETISHSSERHMCCIFIAELPGDHAKGCSRCGSLRKLLYKGFRYYGWKLRNGVLESEEFFL